MELWIMEYVNNKICCYNLFREEVRINLFIC